MPTNQNAYNSRVTDEALEKRFRDTFTSQGGAELVSDLYASGVIVPIVDFTAAAEGSSLRQDLQVAWDFSNGNADIANAQTTIINTTGFWKIGGTLTSQIPTGSTAVADIDLFDGSTNKTIWKFRELATISDVTHSSTFELIVFVNSGDSVRARTNQADTSLSVWYRQIADINGNLTNPLGFTSS